MSEMQSLLRHGPRTIMVAGSRGWHDADTIDEALSDYVIRGDTIIHGGATGADGLAEEWALHHSHETLVFKPNYDLYGSRAPHVRNDHMLNLADQVVAFWDGKSRGTKSVISKAKNLGIPVDVIRG